MFFTVTHSFTPFSLSHLRTKLCFQQHLIVNVTHTFTPPSLMDKSYSLFNNIILFFLPKKESYILSNDFSLASRKMWTGWWCYGFFGPARNFILKMHLDSKKHFPTDPNCNRRIFNDDIKKTRTWHRSLLQSGENSPLKCDSVRKSGWKKNEIPCNF